MFDQMTAQLSNIHRLVQVKQGQTVIQPGDEFTRLTVLDRPFEKNKWGKKLWWCRCTCGTEFQALQNQLVGGNTKSCGCLRADRVREMGAKARQAAKEKGIIRGVDGRYQKPDN